ncbi:MAG: TonB-dependent receptor [Pseudomonadota bacterium]
MAVFRLNMGGVCLALMASTAGVCPAFAQTQALPELVVTATGRAEPTSQIAGTVQVINRDTIEHSTAKSVTDLLAENAVGFMSEWTAHQTSLNIRGAATEGQGRDYKSQVLVLINGHRAGTANISKLSIADIDRIEVVRGPSSVVYGSQNMGGVVNIIMKTGRSAPGTLLEVSGGSWDFLGGRAQTGGSKNGFDWYVGLASSGRSDYSVGGGNKEGNTAWKRYGGSSSLGWQIDPNNRVDLNFRQDGIYDTGFRGSTANLFAYDDRYNRSFDVSYNGKMPVGPISWFWQGYGVTDIDNLNQPSPLGIQNSVPNRTTIDNNKRTIDVVGQRFQPRANFWAGNDLLVGFDWERSWIRSDHFRAGGTGVTQTSPQDNNQTENVYAFYAEDSQKFFNDRLTVRGGVRRTIGATTLDPTPYAPTLVPGTTNYQATTYAVGSTFQFTNWLTGRVGMSTGFRAPTATELGANFTSSPTNASITYGNPNLKPETSQQIEVGGTASWNGARVDLALFQNVIRDRITTRLRTGSTNTSDTINNPGDITVQGLELQSEADMLRILSWRVPNWRWSVFGNGYYHFKMLDAGAPAAALSDKATRINQYELSIGTRFGQPGDGSDWSKWNLQVQGLWRGPVWYNTEEFLNPLYYPGQVRNTTVYRKGDFWVFNLRGEIEARKNVTLFAMVKNIFDVNDHPVFIVLDKVPCTANLANQNGSCGNSMPGREFIVGMQARW